MKSAIRLSSQFNKGDANLLVIPFSGGTPSGDGVGTTFLNTKFSDTF